MRFVFPLAAVLCSPLLAVPASAQSVAPIEFARGATSMTVSGILRGDRYIDYRVAVIAGQRLTVALRVATGSAYFNVMEPGSRDVAIYNSSTGEQRFSDRAARSGAYTIRVYQMRATARRGEIARFSLSVEVTGRVSDNSAPAHRTGDALVPGTPYHATAMIRCRAAAGMTMAQCKAGVIRRLTSATVHLDRPGGGERTIVFRGGKAVSSDSGSPLRVDRRGDTSIVRTGMELYEIPDALIAGG